MWGYLLPLGGPCSTAKVTATAQCSEEGGHHCGCVRSCCTQGQKYLRGKLAQKLLLLQRTCSQPLTMSMRHLLSGRAGQAALRRCLPMRGGAAAPLVPGHIEPPHVRLPLPRQEVRQSYDV